MRRCRARSPSHPKPRELALSVAGGEETTERGVAVVNEAFVGTGERSPRPAKRVVLATAAPESLSAPGAGTRPAWSSPTNLARWNVSATWRASGGAVEDLAVGGAEPSTPQRIERIHVSGCSPGQSQLGSPAGLPVHGAG
jgi:hypothetical protein